MDSQGIYTACITGMVIFYLAIGAVTAWLNLPVMRVDHLTGACVSVESMYNQFTCEKPPKKYDAVNVASHQQ